MLKFVLIRRYECKPTKCRVYYDQISSTVVDIFRCDGTWKDECPTSWHPPSGWNWKESFSVIIRRHDYKCAFDASHCSPLVQVQEELDGLMDFLVEWGSATITARASPLWNTILSLYWIKMMMSAQYRSRISTYTLGAPCLFISRYPTPTIHRNRRQRSWMIYSQQIFSFQQ